jgi:hypothetical protein
VPRPYPTLQNNTPIRYSDLLPASACLSKVVLRNTGSMLPDARYGSHMFAGRQLPSLRHLCFGWDSEAGDDEATEADDLPAAFLDDAGLLSLAICCPALRKLQLPGCLINEVQLAPLLQLTALTMLLLAGNEIDDDCAAQQLTLLTDLKDLEVLLSSELTDVGVAHLTVLTKLRRLAVCDCDISEGMSDPDEEGSMLLCKQVGGLQVVIQMMSATMQLQ